MLKVNLSGALRAVRRTALMLGLAMMLVLMLGVATTALAAVPGDPFRLGRVNTINALTTLVGSVNNAMLKVDNNSTGTGATALNLQVEPGKPPMSVNSSTKVTNLNVDQVDGKSADELVSNYVYASVDFGGVLKPDQSLGALRAERPFGLGGGTAVYFDRDLTGCVPTATVSSGFPQRATIQTTGPLGGDPGLGQNGVLVSTYESIADTPRPIDRRFNLVVHCPPGGSM